VLAFFNFLISRVQEFRYPFSATNDERCYRGILTLKQAAERMNMSVTKFKAATKELATN
jgi:hypothetical protein